MDKTFLAPLPFILWRGCPFSQYCCFWGDTLGCLRGVGVQLNQCLQESRLIFL